MAPDADLVRRAVAGPGQYPVDRTRRVLLRAVGGALLASCLRPPATLLANPWPDRARQLQTAPSPEGFVDRLLPSLGYVRGWAKDPDSERSLWVKLYLEDAQGQAYEYRTVLANILRENGSHGWEASLPPGYRGRFSAVAIGRDDAQIGQPVTTVLPAYTDGRLWVPIDADGRIETYDAVEPQASHELAIAGTRLRLRLGPAHRLLRVLDYGIRGAAPDGHISVVRDGDAYKVFFTYWTNHTSETDRPSQKSGLSIVNDMEMPELFQSVVRDGDSEMAKYVLAPADRSAKPEDQYTAISSVVRHPRLGSYFMAYHAEQLVADCRDVTHARISLAISDDGTSFAKLGPIIESPYPIVSGACVGQGAAHAQMFLDGDYIYAIYDRWPPTHAQGGFALARAHLDDPTTWMNYKAGSFSETAIGGDADVILPRTTNGNIWFPSIVRIPEGYLLIYSDFRRRGLYVRFSESFLDWRTSQETEVWRDSESFGYRYPTLVGEHGSSYLETSGSLIAAGFPIGQDNADGLETGINALPVGRSLTLLRD